jgi:peptidoglycan-associated lipoprotein
MVLLRSDRPRRIDRVIDYFGHAVAGGASPALPPGPVTVGPPARGRRRTASVPPPDRRVARAFGREFGPGAARLAVVSMAIFLLVGGCAKRPAVLEVSAPAPTGRAAITEPTAPEPAPRAVVGAVTPAAPEAKPEAEPAPRVAAPATPEAPAAPAPPTPAPPTPAPAPPAAYAPVPELTDVHFDFDKSDIRPDAARVLDRNAEWLLANPDYLILIEGHCDERGTNAYNLALGDRRARSARDFLVARGVAAARMTTVSYGEERPQCIERSEECWSKNRRSHFLAKRG